MKFGSPASLACERISCEFPLPVRFRKEMIVPPAILANQELPAWQNESLSVWTAVLERLSPIDVACSTQLSKNFCLPPMAGSPDWERLERLRLRLVLSALLVFPPPAL